MIPINYLTSRFVQVPGTTVITQSAPEVKDIIQRCRSKRVDIRKSFHKGVKIRNDRFYLRLLQHDLTDPDPIRSDIFLPWKVFSTMPIVPVKDALAEVSGNLVHQSAFKTKVEYLVFCC